MIQRRSFLITAAVASAGCATEGQSEDNSPTETQTPEPAQLGILDVSIIPNSGDTAIVGDVLTFEVTVENSGGRDTDADYTLYLEESTIANRVVYIPGGTEVTFKDMFDTTGMVSQTVDYRIELDDTSTGGRFQIEPNRKYEEYLESFENQLEGDIPSPEAEFTGDRIVIKYISGAANKEYLEFEVGWVVGAFLRQIDEGLDIHPLEGRIHGSEGKLALSFYVREEWVRRYVNNSYSAGDVGALAVETIDTVD